MSDQTRISLVITELESSFSTTFRTCANDYYGVYFDNSDVVDNMEKLNRLLALVKEGSAYKGRMRHTITVGDVERIIQLFQRVFARYSQLFGPIPSQMKLYSLFRILRDAETPNPVDVAKQALGHILNPVRTNKKETLDDSAERLSKERQLKRMQKLKR